MIDYSKRKIDYKNRKPKVVNYDTLLQIRINKELKDKAYRVAEKKGISIPEVIRKALERFIKNNDEN